MEHNGFPNKLTRRFAKRNALARAGIFESTSLI